MEFTFHREVGANKQISRHVMVAGDKYCCENRNSEGEGAGEMGWAGEVTLRR